MRWWALPAWVLAVASLAVAPVAADDALAVEGRDRTRVLAPAGARFDDYRSSGYRLARAADEVVVDVDVSPIQSRARFVPPRRAAGDGVERLARAVTAGAETRYEAISKVLGWVARHLEYDLDRSAAQSVEAVLERRSGYCTGVARFTAALLEAVDIPAREVAGYVVGAGEEGRSSGYHRWIEAYLPDRGWVMSDPLATHHYVPATYLRLASEELEPTRGTRGLLLERHDRVTAVDLYPGAPRGVTARRNTSRQLAAAVRVRLEDAAVGTAVLTGPGARWTHALIDGATTFVGLDPGSYRLRLSLPGRGVLERALELRGRERQALLLRSPELRSGRAAAMPDRDRTGRRGTGYARLVRPRP